MFIEIRKNGESLKIINGDKLETIHKFNDKEKKRFGLEFDLQGARGATLNFETESERDEEFKRILDYVAPEKCWALKDVGGKCKKRAS